MEKKTMISLLAVSMLMSCAEKQTPGGGGNGSSWGSDIPEGNVEISVLSDIKTMLRNPMSGWVIYVPLVDDVGHFWEMYDNFQSSEGKVKVSDYGTTLYLRGSWTDFNPEEGVYIWQEDCNTPQAESLRQLEAGAEERGLKLAFTLKTDSRDANANCTPDFVKQKMDARYGADAAGYLTPDGKTHTPGKGYFNFTLGTDPPRHYWSPYSDDPIFQEEYAKFINALAAEYNDPEKTMFISGLGMGKWGEYHTCIYSAGDDSPRQEVFEWVTDVYADAFTKVPVVTNYHKFVGSTASDGPVNELCDLSEVLLTSAINKGFSMRHDAFGMTSSNFGYAGWEKNFIAKWKFKVPVIGEGGWIVTHGDYTSDEGGGYRTPRDLRIGEYEQMNSAYVNMMDLRYDASGTQGETWSWFNDAFDYVKKFIEEDCYRLYPDKLTIPSKIVNGNTYIIQHRWTNIGHAYCPTNIRQYKDRFKVAFAVMTTDGEIVGDNIFFAEDAYPHDWTSEGGKKSYELEITPDNIPSGPYVIAVGIVDLALGDPENGDYRIGIHLGAQGEFTEDGWLKLAKVAVVDK